MKKYISESDQETKQIAEDFAVRYAHHKPLIIALTGDLGAGKTTFVQGFAKGLGIKDKIISPTFVLIRQHQIPKTKKILNHIDLYRLESIEDIKTLGLKEILLDSNNVVLIEWAEKLKSLPMETIKISIQKTDHDRREILIS